MEWIKTADRYPERVKDVSYSSVLCLVAHKGDVKILVFNHEHDCWDDETGDDYECDPADVSHWMPIPDLPTDIAYVR